jgi:hypothetical protein
MRLETPIRVSIKKPSKALDDDAEHVDSRAIPETPST